MKRLCNYDAGYESRENRTIDELKQVAEENFYDGFTVFPDIPSYSDTVYFKKCNVEDNLVLIKALSYQQGSKFYLNMAHPCTQPVVETTPALEYTGTSDYESPTSVDPNAQHEMDDYTLLRSIR